MFTHTATHTYMLSFKKMNTRGIQTVFIKYVHISYSARFPWKYKKNSYFEDFRGKIFYKIKHSISKYILKNIFFQE